MVQARRAECDGPDMSLHTGRLGLRWGVREAQSWRLMAGAGAALAGCCTPAARTIRSTMPRPGGTKRSAARSPSNGRRRQAPTRRTRTWPRCRRNRRDRRGEVEPDDGGADQRPHQGRGSGGASRQFRPLRPARRACLRAPRCPRRRTIRAPARASGRDARPAGARSRPRLAGDRSDGHPADAGRRWAGAGESTSGAVPSTSERPGRRHRCRRRRDRQGRPRPPSPVICRPLRRAPRLR